MKPENQHLITKIKTARSSGIRPLSIILYEQPNTKWKPIDFALLEALQVLEQETCGKCGHPIWICRTHDRDVMFQARSYVCQGERAIKEAEVQKLRGDEKKQAMKDSKDWGKSYYSVPILAPQAERTELPTRKEYYESLKDMA